MIIFPVTPIWNLGFLSYLPPGFQFQKNKGQGSLGRGHTRFPYGHRHRSQRLPGLESLVIRWRRTPSPGLTVKGGSDVLLALYCVGVWARVGEGFPVAGYAMKGCCHLLAQVYNLHGSQKQETCVHAASKPTFCGNPPLLLLFNLSGFENQPGSLISTCLTFPKMISLYPNALY